MSLRNSKFPLDDIRKVEELIECFPQFNSYFETDVHNGIYVHLSSGTKIDELTYLLAETAYESMAQRAVSKMEQLHRSLTRVELIGGRVDRASDQMMGIRKRRFERILSRSKDIPFDGTSADQLPLKRGFYLAAVLTSFIFTLYVTTSLSPFSVWVFGDTSIDDVPDKVTTKRSIDEIVSTLLSKAGKITRGAKHVCTTQMEMLHLSDFGFLKELLNTDIDSVELAEMKKHDYTRQLSVLSGIVSNVKRESEHFFEVDGESVRIKPIFIGENTDVVEYIVRFMDGSTTVVEKVLSEAQNRIYGGKTIGTIVANEALSQTIEEIGESDVYGTPAYFCAQVKAFHSQVNKVPARQFRNTATQLYNFIRYLSPTLLFGVVKEVRSGLKQVLIVTYRKLYNSLCILLSYCLCRRDRSGQQKRPERRTLVPKPVSGGDRVDDTPDHRNASNRYNLRRTAARGNING